MHIVATDVKIHLPSPTNVIPAIIRRRAEQRNAIKISDKCHYFILDKISRRERLEYDPGRILVDNEPDHDSNEEEGEEN